ncbi:hypothetical protein [Paenibacillus gansuensis]|uniref:Uncharacterized protein n=1 Tax=Paenibacillus gansuensis TaxID=306542 RepID=A0ABW5PIK8_9BACL
MASGGDLAYNQQENELNFQPLFRALVRLNLTKAERDEAIDNYMFMFIEDGRFAYKHSWTRQYVYLDEAGGIQGGILNTGDFSSPPC